MRFVSFGLGSVGAPALLGLRSTGSLGPRFLGSRFLGPGILGPEILGPEILGPGIRVWRCRPLNARSGLILMSLVYTLKLNYRVTHA